MKVEIWSDVMCPFCYIGKRKFELALNQFEGKENVHVVWKSFQLNPDLKTNPDKNINQYLAEIVNMVPSAINIKHYANIVQKKFVLRSFINGIYRREYIITILFRN